MALSNECSEVVRVEFRVDVDGLRFVVAEPPQQRRDYESGALKTDSEGRPLWQVRVLAMGGGGSAPLRVGVAGDPGLEPGQFVRPVGLAVNSVERRGDLVVWWTAERFELEQIAGPAAGGPAGGGKSAGVKGGAGE